VADDVTTLDILIVDDEAPGRQRLRELLEREPGVRSLREAVDGESAVASIREAPPDLVFLDVQMPGLDGLGVVDRVGAKDMPMTVFVTAYDRHAVRAFDHNALDYLLKPFSDERFEAAMARVRARRDEQAAYLASSREQEFPDPVAPLERLAVKVGATTRLVPTAELDWIGADGVYVQLHSGERSWLHRATLAHLESRLDPARFVRIHRSTIVNLERIERLENLSHGELDVILKDGVRLKLSRSFRARLEERLGQPV
jgi:two-component system LytT family response regulator